MLPPYQLPACDEYWQKIGKQHIAVLRALRVRRAYELEGGLVQHDRLSASPLFAESSEWIDAVDEKVVLKYVSHWNALPIPQREEILLACERLLHIAKGREATSIARTIAGLEITLLSGERYVASRIGAQTEDEGECFTVEIRKRSEALDSPATCSIADLTYDAADKFINEFNIDGGHYGRLWI